MNESERLLLRPEEAAAALGVSRTAIFRLIKTNAIESVKIASSRRIPIEALTAYVHGLRDASSRH